MSTESKQPHDALFKHTFSEVEHAAAEFRAVLPAQLVARIDFSTLTLCPGSYVDEALSASQSDLLFSVQVSDKPALLYVLFEHQSSPDKLMPLRLLRYIVRILMRHANEAKTTGSDPLPLPVVVPVVLHHGKGGWSVATRLEELFDPQLVEEAGLTELVPRLSFVLDDLNHVTDEELEQRALGLLPKLTLWVLRDARSKPRFERSLARWSETVAELLRAPNGPEAYWTLLRYIFLVADDSLAIAFNEAVTAAQPDAKDAAMTLAEKWIAEGKAEGKAEAKADILRKLLTLRFGELTEATARRIASASDVDLDRWVERVLTADTVDAVLGG